MRSEARPELGVLRSDWDRAARSMSLSSAFVGGWWVDHAATGQSVLLCCFDGDDFIGGAAFQIDAIGRGPLGIERVRMLGQGPLAPDHLDVVAAPEHQQAVAREVVAWLRRPGNRIVDLDGLAAEGELAQLLIAGGSSVIDRVGAPWAPLPADGGAYMAERPGQLRSTAKRTTKRLEQAGASIRQVESKDAARALADLARLHDGRWSDDSDFLTLWATFTKAATAGLADGSVRITELVAADGDVMASELDLVAGSSLELYQAGRSTDRDWRGAGTMLKAAVISAACSDGFTGYDLLRGDEPYKSDWATERRELLRIRFGVGAIGTTAARGAAAWKQRQDRRSSVASDESSETKLNASR